MYISIQTFIFGQIIEITNLALFLLIPAIAEPIASIEAKFDFPTKEKAFIFFIMGRRSDLPTVYAP